MNKWVIGAIVAGSIVGIVIVADLAVNWVDYQNAYTLMRYQNGLYP